MFGHVWVFVPNSALQFDFCKSCLCFLHKKMYKNEIKNLVINKRRFPKDAISFLIKNNVFYFDYV